MIEFQNMGWLPEITSFISEKPTRHLLSAMPKKKSSHLGILAFEAAKTMSRLVSLYKSLSDEEISRLMKHIIKSEGVAYLNSMDEEFLLSLACAERLEDLDRAVAAVSRLGKKCNDFELNRFDLVYADLKLGFIDFGKLEYGSRVIERKVQKMEKLVSTTSCLHAALEALAEMEVSERKLQQWKIRQTPLENGNLNLFYQKLENQRKEVRYFTETSLWRKTFDKSVSLMATIVFVVYARICMVFKPFVPILPSISVMEPIKEQILRHSVPILSEPRPSMIRFYSRKSDVYLNEYDSLGTDREKLVTNNRVFHAAGPSTLGGSGLALHYANVIMLAEKYLYSAASIGHHERESLYQMLPENLKSLVRTKLSKNMKCKEDDAFLAEGWRDAMIEIMGWLAPMAHNTVTWQMERNVERTKFDVKPCVLLLQTLHFSDKEKTETAIAEVLVGLSCIYRFENRRLRV
ncbi:hypothetical protein CDL12_10275 [Handroanthus impetiginosus]|uniref:DUF668 domain-containing protein n=1 Tax=Handroanthus impetiginosus TaxID=429701 RepID=A0A2G9HI31_9LAMI|nr:hypothetical protein CDL12_10275 [Handroanthus impetiginosus]